MQVVGCCGWSEAQNRYLSEFPTIELQTTFYQPPAAGVAERWKALAPPDFLFCMKAWQLITHTPASPTYRRLKSAVSLEERDLYGNFRPTEQVQLAWEHTRQIAGILDAKVIVFQCPKSFLPTRENVRNVSRFFRDIDRDGRCLAWEPRGDEWQAELVREICVDYRLTHVVDPFQNSSISDSAVYWRLHGKGGYRYQYTDEDLAILQSNLAERSKAPGLNFVMFNNIYSLQDARRFRKLLEAE